jgi:hypothetical protein
VHKSKKKQHQDEQANKKNLISLNENNRVSIPQAIHETNNENQESQSKQEEIVYIRDSQVNGIRTHEKDTVPFNFSNNEKEKSDCKENEAGRLLSIESSKQVLKGSTTANFITNTNKKEHTIRSLFVLSSQHAGKSQLNKLRDCLGLFEILYEQTGLIDHPEFVNQGQSAKKSHLLEGVQLELADFDLSINETHLGIYGNRKSTLQMLGVEQAELKRLGSDKWWIFDVWRGNISKLANELTKSQSLSDLLLSLYQASQWRFFNSSKDSSNGHSLLDDYIEQLCKSGIQNAECVHKAVMYSLASHNVAKAVQIYLAHNMYQYALCVSQLRSAPGDELIERSLQGYASYASNNGDFETALLCYIRLADFESSCKMLSRRDHKNDPECINLIDSLFKKFLKFIT